MKTSDKPKKFSKLIDGLGLFSSFVMIIMFVFMLYFSSKFFTSTFGMYPDLPSKVFFLSVFVCIVSVFSEWISGRIKYISNVIKIGRKKEVFDGRGKGSSKEGSEDSTPSYTG